MHTLPVISDGSVAQVDTLTAVMATLFVTAVCGVADDPAFVKDAFFAYIDRTRVRPLHLQTQYNSWFDHGGGVSREKFAASVAKIHAELVETRAALLSGYRRARSSNCGRAWAWRD